VKSALALAAVLIISVCAVFFLLTVATAGASPQMGTLHDRPPMRGVLNPVVGLGAQYEIVTPHESKSVVEMVIVGKETVDGKNAYWLEDTVSNTPVGQIVTKWLTVMDGQNTFVSRVVMQVLNRPPMEMTAEMAKAMSSLHAGDIPGQADIRMQGNDVGSESVKTPAGTFATEHYVLKDGSGDAWIADNAGLYGLVKFQGKGTTILLTKVITDGKDKITGKPQPFNPALMQKEEQQQP
jgi:hypothetical protein